MIIGSEINTGAIGKRPSLCALSDGRIIVAFDNWSAVGVTMEGASKWTTNTLATSGKSGGKDVFNASRLYVATIATDGSRFVTAWRNGIKEWGSESVYGPAFSNGSVSKVLPSNKPFTKGAVRIAYDSIKKQYVAFSKDGACLVLSGNLDMLGQFRMDIGKTGEKLAFAIMNGKYHAVMGGFSSQGSSYCLGAGERVEWAAFASYKDMSPDENYPGIGLFNPNKAVVGAIYGGQLRYNIIQGGIPKHKSYDLPSLGEGTKGDRMAPSFCKLGKGMHGFWALKGRVMGARIGKASQVICEGEMPCGIWNKTKECVSLSYVRNGLICVRELREG